MTNWPTIIPWIGLLVGLLCLWAAMAANRKRRLVDDIPTSKTSGVFIGHVELKGTAESENFFTSYLAGASCVLYSWRIAEHWSRTITEHYTDSQGRSRTRTRRESGWATVDHGGETAPFYLMDDHGVILVRPQGAEIEMATIFEQTCNRGDDLYYGKGPPHAVSNSDHRRRFTETAITLHHPIYVLGQSQLREDIIAPELAAHDDCPLYLVSVRDEAQISSGYGIAIYVWWVVGLLLSIIPAIFAAQASYRWNPQFNPVIPGLVTGFLYLLATAAAWVWMVYNSLVRLRQRVEQGWSQVDVQLNRRHDLIPNLVAAVKAYADHESEVQTTLAELRSQLNATPPDQAGPDLHGMTSKLVILAEHYPQLQADESFLKLQRELADTETRIALARGYFNEVATHYNTRLQVIPERFVAAIANMRPRPLLEISEFERALVDVKLTQS